MVTGNDVAALLGRGDDVELIALADQAVPIITAMVSAYTRGQGFDKAGLALAYELDAVITTATARFVTNPDSNVRETIGDYTVQPAVFSGFTLPELYVLNRYRKRAT